MEGPPSEGLPLGRLVGVVLALVVTGALVFAVAVRLLGEGPEDLTLASDEPVDALPPRVVVQASDRVRMTVEIDGATTFDGWLCPREGKGCEGRGALAIDGGLGVAVTLDDLTRAKVRYDGRLVEPLGNHTARRRLVFREEG